MVARAQVLIQVILSRKAVATFARTVFDGAVTVGRVVYAGIMALQVGRARERVSA